MRARPSWQASRRILIGIICSGTPASARRPVTARHAAQPPSESGCRMRARRPRRRDDPAGHRRAGTAGLLGLITGLPADTHGYPGMALRSASSSSKRMPRAMRRWSSSDPSGSRPPLTRPRSPPTSRTVYVPVAEWFAGDRDRWWHGEKRWTTHEMVLMRAYCQPDDDGPSLLQGVAAGECPWSRQVSRRAPHAALKNDGRRSAPVGDNHHGVGDPRVNNASCKPR